MGKILFWFIIIIAVLFGARLLSRGGGSSKPAGQLNKNRSPDNNDMSQAEAMVRCEHCGIHMPRSEAYLSNGQTWCGPDHARLSQDPRKP